MTSEKEPGVPEDVQNWKVSVDEENIPTEKESEPQADVEKEQPKSLENIIDEYKENRGLEFKIVNPTKDEAGGFSTGDSITVKRSDKTIEKDWKILGFGELELKEEENKKELYAICLKADGTYKALEPSFLNEIKQREEERRKELNEIADSLPSISDIEIIREPETAEESGRVEQAKSLLPGLFWDLEMAKRRKDYGDQGKYQREVDFWTGILQNGGQEKPSYKPELQTQTKRKKKD